MCQGTKALRTQKIQIQIWRAVLEREERKREEPAAKMMYLPPWLSSGRFQITVGEDKQGQVRNSDSDDMGGEIADW